VPFCSGSLTDIVGVVVYVGGWERDAMRLPQSSGEATGQFWVRVWLRLADHTTVDATAGTVATVPVRIYVDRERYLS
jgi:hypothetical protein